MNSLRPGFVPISDTEIPTGWSKEQLGNLAKIIQGGRLRYTKEFDYLTSGVPAYSAAGQDGFVETAEYHATDGVVLSSIGANCGRVFLASGDWTTLANVQAILPGGRLSARYLYHRINEPSYWERSGSAQPFIKPSSVKGSWIFLPPHFEQDRIAEILDTADEAIRATERLIAKLEQSKQGLLRDLFTYGVNDADCLRVFSTDEFRSSNLGRIPYGWRVNALGDLGPQGMPVLRTGPFGSSLKGSDWVESGVPVITIGSLGEGILDYNELLFISEGKAITLDSYRVSEGEIVFSRVADVGRSVVVRFEQSGWVMSSNLMKITLDRRRVVPDYVQLALAYDHRVRRQLRSTVNSSGRDVVSRSIVSSLLIPLPPVKEQRRICIRASQQQASIELEVDVLAKLRLLKQGLMNGLLTGRVRVGASA